MFFSNITSSPLQLFKTAEHLKGDKLHAELQEHSYDIPANIVFLEFELRVEKQGAKNHSILVPTNFKKNNEDYTKLAMRVANSITDKTKFSFLSVKQEDYIIYHAPFVPYTNRRVMTFAPTFTDIYIIQSDKGTSYHIDNLGELCEKDFFTTLEQKKDLSLLHQPFLSFAQKRQLLSSIPQAMDTNKSRDSTAGFKHKI